MKKKLIRIPTLVLCLALVFSGTVFAAGNDAIQKKADVLTETLGVASVSFALMDGGEIVLSGASGLADKASNRAPNDDTMYGIGSTSKMFTTAIIMKLVDEGKIDLDKPVAEYVKTFEMADGRYKDITVRMLLNHSSGLMGSTYANGFLWDDVDTQAHDTLLSDLKSQRLKADPGAYSVYCNDGFTLAEIVAEHVTQKSFTSLIHEMITGPLSMESTKTAQDRFDFAQLARSYSAANPELAQPNEIVNIIGTGGVYSTALDLCTFGTIFTGEADILSDASINATMEKEYLNGQWMEDVPNIIAFGLGWDSVDMYPFSEYGIQALVKGGDALNFHASLVVLPEHNMSAAVVSSGGVSTYNQMLAGEMLLQRLLEKGVIDAIKPDKEITPPVKKALDAEMRQYEGLYASSLQICTIAMTDEGVLTLANAYLPTAAEEYIYIGDGRFMDETGSVSLSFLEQEGNVYLMQDGIANIEGLSQTVSAAYVMQKLPAYEMPEEYADAWQARNGKAYLMVNGKVTSVAFTSALPAANLLFNEVTGGYLVGNKVVSNDEASAFVEIPMSAGRDMFDYYFVLENGVEYMHMGDNIFMELGGVAEIYGGARSICTIQPSGYTRWYMIGEALDGKTMKVQAPENGGFALYTAGGLPVNHSAASGSFEAVLSAGGFIAFIGDAGARFEITIE